MSQNNIQDHLDLLLAETEHQEFLHALLEQAIENEEFEVACAVIFDDAFKMSADQLKEYLKYAAVYNHEKGQDNYLIIQALLNYQNIDDETVESIVKDVIPDILLRTATKTLEQEQKRAEDLANMPQDRRVDLQIQFKGRLDLNEMFLTSVKEEQWETAKDILQHEDFKLLSWHLTEAITPITFKAPGLFICDVANRTDFKLNPNNLPIYRSLFRSEVPFLQKLFKPSADIMMDYARDNMLKKISQSSCYDRLADCLFYSNRSTILNADPDRIKAFGIKARHINKLFKHGTIPYYKPVLSDTDNYETLLSLAIKQKKWTLVKAFIQARDDSSVPIDFHQKISQGGSAYDLLKKAAKKSIGADICFDYMMAAIAKAPKPSKKKRRLPRLVR